MICEDLWHDQPLKLSVAAGAKLVISINASPFDVNKHEARVSLLQKKQVIIIFRLFMSIA
jgi:NAD+ synthase (glutamine-hydrolysing)